MAMITYPLNNVEYTAEDAELYNSTRTSGVYSGEDFSWSLTGDDNNITVGKGLAWIKNGDFAGKVVAHKEAEVFDFGIAPTSAGRVDVLAIQFDSNKNATELVIKKGIEDGNYAIPERETNSGLYELYIFSVRRRPGAGYISPEDVTDLRDNREYCGYMSESIKEGYAPSLMEHNKGEDFRFWVGTEEEYEEQKSYLPPNTFCVTTNGPVMVAEWSNVDKITDVGWYKFDHDVVAGGITANYAYMRVDGYNERHANQTVYVMRDGTQYKLIRRLSNKIWGDWLWENPPMFSKTIYKTTEMLFGNYLNKLVIQGGAVSGTQKVFTFEELGIETNKIVVADIRAMHNFAGIWRDINEVGYVRVDAANKNVVVNVGEKPASEVNVSIKFYYTS